MIEMAVIEEIQRLSAAGTLTQREIAERMRVSRGTVGAVESGKRLAHKPPAKKKQVEVSTGPVRRCPECGGMVAMPCFACRIRRLAGRLPGRHSAVAWGEPLRLELAEKERGRYEEMRRKRMLALGRHDSIDEVRP